MTESYKGQCLCGSVVYEVDKIEPKMGHCHCSMCRKFHGAAFATFGEAKPENFRWLSGENSLVDYVAENGTTRQFCKKCGSSMTFSPRHNPEGLVEFALGTLDSEIGLQADAHIYIASKVSWCTVNDDLPQFEAGRDS